MAKLARLRQRTDNSMSKMTEALRNQLELTHLGHVAGPDPELDAVAATATRRETPAMGQVQLLALFAVCGPFKCRQSNCAACAD